MDTEAPEDKPNIHSLLALFFVSNNTNNWDLRISYS